MGKGMRAGKKPKKPGAGGGNMQQQMAQVQAMQKQMDEVQAQIDLVLARLAEKNIVLKN